MKKVLILLLFPLFTFAQFNPVAFYEFGKQRKVFESTWKTDNTSGGSSATNQVRLPLPAGGTYNFVADWGDGTSTRITNANYSTVNTHTYSVAGTYIIKIKGICVGWQFNNSGDRGKILSIKTWGNFKLGNQGGYFNGCSNLNLSTVEDKLDLTGTTTLLNCFTSCSSLSTVNKINEWDMSSVTSIVNMFSGSAFNQNIGNWNLSSCSDFTNAFAFSNFNNGGSPDINNWILKSTGSVIMTSMFQNNLTFNQPIGGWNTSAVTNMSDMFGGGSTGTRLFNQNIGGWNVSKVTDFGSFFGTGNSTNNFNNGGSDSIKNWNIKTTGTVNMAGMFNGCSSFNQPIGLWDTSAVTNMSSMFFICTAFNNGLASGVAGSMLWNTSNVTGTINMFLNATSFNQNLGALNLSLCSNLNSMFKGASKFNNGGSTDINNWVLKTTGSINMSDMFNGCSVFNQNIGAWNVSNVTTMAQMFNGCGAFNNGGSPDINNWVLKTTGSISMSDMFAYAHAFNQPVGSWNTIAVTNMEGMFYGCSVFNQNIGAWNVSNVTTMAGMFYGCSVFNQNIGAWNVSNVTTMVSMFNGCSVFNQNIGAWNVSNVTTMARMFNGCSVFNQNIGSWNVSNVTNFTNFMQNKSAANFSTTNLDAIYNGWSTRLVKTPITIHFGTAKYTAGASAGRAILTGPPNNWVITDGGL